MADTNTNHPRIFLILGLLGLVTAGPLGCIEGDSSTDQDVELRSTTTAAPPPTSTASSESTGEPPSDTTGFTYNCWDDCTDFFMELGLANGVSIPCYCSSTRYHWGASGTDLYRGDSDICEAALHVGAIDTDGGYVEVTARPGQSSYTGSSRNGVDTFDSGSFSKSFQVGQTNCP